MADQQTERIVMVEGTTGWKKKRNGQCGVVLTAAQAVDEGVTGDIVVRMHQDGKEQLRKSDGVRNAKPGITKMLDVGVEEEGIRRHTWL